MIKHLFILSASLILILSCCTKQYQVCQGLDSIQQVTFIGFYHQELDTVYIRKFQSNTNFANAIDSGIIRNPIQSDSTTFTCSLPFTMNVNYDYIVFIKETNSEYKISNITLSDGTCKQCGEKSYSYQYISALKVNNITLAPNGYPSFITLQK